MILLKVFFFYFFHFNKFKITKMTHKKSVCLLTPVMAKFFSVVVWDSPGLTGLVVVFIESILKFKLHRSVSQ